MKDSQEQNLTNNNSWSTNSFDIKETINAYLKHWKWFLLSCIIAFSMAYLYLRYTTPKYAAYAKIMLLDEKNASSPGSAILNEMNTFGEGDSKKVEDEIQVMRSRKLMTNVVKALHLNTQIFVKGRIYDSELYPTSPIKLNFIEPDSIIAQSNFIFYMHILSENAFDFSITLDGEKRKYFFGEKIITPISGIVITPAVDNFKSYVGNVLMIKINSVHNVAEYYKNQIAIAPADRGSKVLNVSLTDPVRAKAIDIIDQLIEEYNRVSIDRKNQESKNTADFINERINLIATDLASVDQTAERFKTGNKLTNVASEADIYLSSSSATEEQLASSRTELNLINFMRESVNDQGENHQAIPSNVGLSDPSINNITAKYNELILERERLMKSSNEKNPVIVRLDQQLTGLKSSLKQSLSNMRNTASIRVNNLQKRASEINSKIFSVPKQERQLRDIQREQGVKESLYLYLLQKREEATISLTATSPNAKIIDDAYSPGSEPISPKPRMIFLASLFLGLALPLAIIYVNDLLDNKIHSKKDLEKIVKNIPIIGEVPKVKGKNNEYQLIEKNDRSVLSESFRIIRTNFDYLSKIRKTEHFNNILFVTSTIKGEGKTFFGINLALTYANTNKKVLLIGADIRNPMIHKFLPNKSKEYIKMPGLTDYLHDAQVNTKSVIQTFNLNNNKIDILLSGKTPPNPAEVLMSERMETLFNEVSNTYDIVIVDTAPSLLVTDTLLFSKFAAHTFYVVRADVTENKLLNYAKELHQDKKLNNIMLVLNSVKKSNFGYGAKYGYGYGVKEKKKFFKF